MGRDGCLGAILGRGRESEEFASRLLAPTHPRRLRNARGSPSNRDADPRSGLRCFPPSPLRSSPPFPAWVGKGPRQPPHPPACLPSLPACLNASAKAGDEKPCAAAAAVTALAFLQSPASAAASEARKGAGLRSRSAPPVSILMGKAFFEPGAAGERTEERRFCWARAAVCEGERAGFVLPALPSARRKER